MDGERNVPKQSSHKPKAAKLATVNSTILGAAAEHYVMCQLLRQDMIAALAPAGVPNADIVVTDKLGSKVAAVQVKARRDIGSDGGWHMKKKHEVMIEPLLFYCFVDFGKRLADAPKCWVIPSAIVADTLKRSYEAWLKAPGRGGRPHKDHDMRRLLPDYHPYPIGKDAGWLNEFYENWVLLKGAASAS
jgi:hypothetical protein